MTTPKRILLGAADLIDRGWCRGAYARNAAGDRTGSVGQDACAWCAAGAIYRAAFDLDAGRRLTGASMMSLLRHLGLPEGQSYSDAITAWSDQLDRPAVAAGLRGAAAGLS